jgi:hypothetical protein
MASEGEKGFAACRSRPDVMVAKGHNVVHKLEYN